MVERKQVGNTCVEGVAQQRSPTGAIDEEARQDREYPIFERAEVMWVGCRRTAGMSGMSLKTLGVSDVDNMDEATVCVT